MTGDLYVQSVIDQVPPGLPVRDQIAMDLRSHIAERLDHNQSIDEVVQQLGDPLRLAESYLAAVPLRSAPFSNRLAAKVIDVAIFIAGALAMACALWLLLPDPVKIFGAMASLFAGIFGFVIYTVVAESREGATVGKRLMGLRVVRESGARISLGQSFVRQLPFFGQFFWIDAGFALFTDHRQRAFELLTKTRTIAVLLCAGIVAPALMITAWTT